MPYGVVGHAIVVGTRRGGVSLRETRETTKRRNDATNAPIKIPAPGNKHNSNITKNPPIMKIEGRTQRTNHVLNVTACRRNFFRAAGRNLRTRAGTHLLGMRFCRKLLSTHRIRRRSRSK